MSGNIRREDTQMLRTNATTIETSFPGHNGSTLSARFDIPAGFVRATALFAHCFTCSKEILAAKRIAAELARSGIAVLRFDFTGLGSSEGEFASTNFSSNIQDLKVAADYLREHHTAPSLLIGHSLGGSAVLAVASEIPEAKAVVTIGAPSNPDHLLSLFTDQMDKINEAGKAHVSIAGQAFTIEKQFIDDLKSSPLEEHVANLNRPYLNLHAPGDQSVDIDHASTLFLAAKHPKSFISLDRADHLLTKSEDANYAAQVIAGWVSRFLPHDATQDLKAIENVHVSETREGKFQQTLVAGRHRLFADEPEKYGGLDSGLSPYDFLSAALASCTGMTLRMYADFKKLELGRISVDVHHSKVHSQDAATAETAGANKAKIDRFICTIAIEGGVPEGKEDKILEIAGKCPVHRTLIRTSQVETELA